MPDKINILFVDDEPNILQGLKRILHSMRREWKMTFVDSGEKALEILASRAMDVLVTDMRMPGIDGLQLLNKVSREYPEIVRIILSGQTNQEMMLQSFPPSHQYLSKPCQVEDLKNTLSRIFSLRELLSNDSLKGLVTKIDILPSRPNVYGELLDLLNSPNVTLRQVGQVIQEDISMTATILKMVNSAYLGLYRKITNVQEAINILGLDMVKAMVVSNKVFSKFGSNKKDHYLIKNIFEHSILVANYSKLIAKLESEDLTLIGESFMAGLLHDIGKLVLSHTLPTSLTEISNIMATRKLSNIESEMEVFNGNSHAEIGAYLLGLWGLPISIVETLAFHHFPSRCSHLKFSPLTAVHIANYLANQNENLSSENDLIVDREYLAQLKLSEKLPFWKSQCKEYMKKRARRQS